MLASRTIFKRNFRALILAFIILLAPAVIFSFGPLTTFLSSVEASPDFNFYQSINVSSKGCYGVGYQIRLNVSAGIGVSSGNQIYLDNHCEDFPDDINFTETDGDNLDYWLETNTSDWAVFWVEIQESLSNANRTFQIRYGDAAQTDTFSNGTNTFYEFTHFPGAALPSGWSVKDSDAGSYNIANSILELNTTTSGFGVWQHYVIGTDATYATGRAIRSLARTYVPTNVRKYGHIGFTQEDDPNNLFYSITNNAEWINGRLGGGGELSRLYSMQTGSIESTDITSLNQSWTTIDITRNATISNYYYGNDTLEANHTSYPPAGSLPILIYISEGSGGTPPNISLEVDWILVRKYCDPEPTVTALDDETSLVPMTYESMDLTTFEQGASVTFFVNATAEAGQNLTGYIFSSNITGTWLSNAYIPLSGDNRNEWINVSYRDTNSAERLDLYSESNRDNERDITALYAASGSAVGQAVRIPSTADAYRLTNTTYYMRRYSADPDGIAAPGLWNTQGTYGSDMRPFTLLVNGDNFSASIIPQSWTLITLNFSGTDQYLLDAGGYYCPGVRSMSGTWNGIDHFIAIGTDQTSPSHSGNAWIKGPSMQGLNHVDTCFYLYGRPLYRFTMPDRFARVDWSIWVNQTDGGTYNETEHTFTAVYAGPLNYTHITSSTGGNLRTFDGSAYLNNYTYIGSFAPQAGGNGSISMINVYNYSDYTTREITRFGGADSDSIRALTVWNNSLYAGDSDGYIYHINASDLSTLASRKVISGIIGCQIDGIACDNSYFYVIGRYCNISRVNLALTSHTEYSHAGYGYYHAIIEYGSYIYVLNTTAPARIHKIAKSDLSTVVATGQCSAGYVLSDDMVTDGTYLYLSIEGITISTPNYGGVVRVTMSDMTVWQNIIDGYGQRSYGVAYENNTNVLMSFCIGDSYPYRPSYGNGSNFANNMYVLSVPDLTPLYKLHIYNETSNHAWENLNFSAVNELVFDDDLNLHFVTYSSTGRNWFLRYNLTIGLNSHTVTFYKNASICEFWLNRVNLVNGTSNFYYNGTIIELVSIPYNASWLFINYTYNSLIFSTNPYNLTINGSGDVWALFIDPILSPKFGAPPITGPFLWLLIAIIILFLIVLLIIVRRRGNG